MNSDLERLDDARKLGTRAHRDAHGAQVLGLEQCQSFDVADIFLSKHGHEALEVEGGQRAFERRAAV